MSGLPPFRSESSEFLTGDRHAGIGITSATIGLSDLASTIDVLEIHDRVLPGKSLSILLALTSILRGFLLMQGTPEWIRGRILLLASHRLDHQSGSWIHRSILALPLQRDSHDDSLRPLRDPDRHVDLTVRAVRPSLAGDSG